MVERDWIQYWDERAKERGGVSVGHLRWDQAQLEAETVRAISFLEPVCEELGLIERVVPTPRPLALDFGCGVGRFIPWLRRRLGFTVYGVDPSPAMRTFARARLESEGLVDCFTGPVFTSEWVYPDGSTQPGVYTGAADAHYDLVFTFTVLQHIPDSKIDGTVDELKRVAKPRAHVLLVENTHDNGNRTSRSGHVVFREKAEYCKFFPGVRAVEDFTIEGERHTIFAGELI